MLTRGGQEDIECAFSGQYLVIEEHDCNQDVGILCVHIHSCCAGVGYTCLLHVI